MLRWAIIFASHFIGNKIKIKKVQNKTNLTINIHLSSNTAAAAAKLLQSCPILCNPIDSSPSGSTIPGILQARSLEWVAISFSNAWKWKLKVKSLRRVWLFTTPCTAAHQAPLSTGFSRQEYWSGVPLPSLSSNIRLWQFSSIIVSRAFLFEECSSCHWIIEKAREFQKNIYFCFIGYAKAFDCVNHNKLQKILKEMGIPDHLNCLLRNLYAGQEATVRTGHGTMDWFLIGKRVCQGCILSLCLFNL